MNPHKYSQLNFNKRAKAIQGSTKVFKKWCWNWITILKKKMNPDTDFMPFIKIN